MNQKLSPLVRSIALICGLFLILTLFVPIWKIELVAPQYPEGLELKIRADKLDGDVEIINGLNHYIGMKKLATKDFVEFQVLPYLLGILAGFGLLTFLVNRRWFYLTYTVFFILFGIISLVDFYRWNYNYGHNLDPTAPIKVPGMAYQPPVFGFKQLLNFGAYSIPDTGGWIILGTGALLLVGALWEIWKTKKSMSGNAKAVVVVFSVIFLSACSTGPRPINVGEDNCAHCKMTVTDIRFASELVTDKGKIFVFDDLACLKAFSESDEFAGNTGHTVYITDFSSGQLSASNNGFLISSEELRSPMGSNTAFFISKDSLEYFKSTVNGSTVPIENYVR